MTISASSISDDVASGAFTFYFARSTRPIDYVLGKLAGLCVLVMLIMLVGPLVLAGVQIALTPENRKIVDQLGIIRRELFIGVLGTLIYAAIPLGFSAISRRGPMALASWAAIIVLGQVAGGFALFVWAPIGALDLAVRSPDLAAPFGLELPMMSVPLWASIPGIVVPTIRLRRRRRLSREASRRYRCRRDVVSASAPGADGQGQAPPVDLDLHRHPAALTARGKPRPSIEPHHPAALTARGTRPSIASHRHRCR